MGLTLNQKTALILFTFVLTCVGICLAYLPAEWSIFRKVAGGVVSGTFWGLCVTANHMLGADYSP